MIEKKVIIKHEDGLHMRPAMFTTELASKFKSNISVTKGDIVADAKSIMEVTMLGATAGEEVIIKAEGEDEQEAIEALAELIKSDFKDLIETEK